MNDTERAIIRAVVHQLAHGEASDILNDLSEHGMCEQAQYETAVRDLQWCRGQLMALLRDTEPKP
jgi:hypothetical protein